jgi:para-aminobenzoate synthetase component 1
LQSGSRIHRVAVPGTFRAADVYGTVCAGRTDSFWLDSGDDGTSFIGLGEAWTPTRPDATLDELSDVLRAMGRIPDAGGTPVGVLGWIDYETAGETLGLELPHDPSRLGSRFLRVDRGVEVGADGSCSLFGLAREDARGADELVEWFRTTTAALLRPKTAGRPAAATESDRSVEWRSTQAEYLDAIAACQDAIRDGDAYVLNLTTQARIAGDFDPLEVYLRLRAATPAHHGGLLRIDDVSLLSSSPETFLRVESDGWMTTSPVKGTRRRESDPEADRTAADALRSDEKECAENVMIVDLMRNDFARVCDPGSVSVPDLLRVETLARVHQLVSTVRGRLREGLTAIDALRACFPAGSMTGAPKRRAVELLGRIEGAPRGLYAGIFGYLALDGTAEFAMTIRSIVLDASGATISAGGGITAMSRPDAEVAEVLLKASPMLGAIGADATWSDILRTGQFL